MTKAVLIDLDGTMYRGGTVIPGAPEFVQQLKKRELPYMFVTNNSSRTPEAVVDHMRSMGIDCELENVCTTAQAAAQYAIDEQLGRRAYVIGEKGLQQALVDAGIEIVQAEPDFVIQGIDRDFNYDKLKLAAQFIREGCPFILTNPDIKLPSDTGFLPGAGTIAASIQAATEVTPILIGKPSPIIMKYALKALALSAEDVWMIGDGMRTDIAAGKAVGCRSALVLSGVTTKENLEAECTAAGTRPDVVCDRLEQLLEHIF